MHVKQVVIEGFKSYKDQTIADPFSSKINVIVGANGSGKSNFFDAFLFVLDQLTSTSHQEERQKLLHEGAGHAVMSAYVELVLDNSDGRMPVDKEEVRLRRTIGLKKDDYYLDKKHITRREVMDLLEAAGFSKANPYYVVKQGKIMSMANMRDNQRLELLKEIGGTKVYEERRRHSITIMRECDDKKALIEELIGQLDSRLKELEEERQELEQYQVLDRQQRSLSYAILDQEIRAIKAELEQVEEKLAAAVEESGAVQDEMREALIKVKDVEREVKQLQARQAALARQQKELRAEKEGAIKRKAQADLDVGELQERIQTKRHTKSTAQRGLSAVERSISEKEGALAGVTARLRQAEAREAELGRELEAKQRRQQALFSQQGRLAQFATADERDEWLRKEIQKMEETISQKQHSLRGTQQQAQETETRLQQLRQDIHDKEREVHEREEGAARAASDYAAQRTKRDELMNQQKALFKEEAEMEGELKRLKGEWDHAQSVLDRMIPRDVSRGLNSLKRIVRDHGIQGVYGLLMEVVDVDEKLYRAVEKTAGTALYHMVVEDDRVATQLTQQLDKGNMGRASFMPLSRIKPPNVQFPKEYGKDVVPLIRHLKFDPKFEPAVRQVFGKTLVCRNLEVAARVAYESNLNCITMEGDKVDKKGAMTGGHNDERRAVIRADREMREIQRQHNELAARKQQVQELLEQVQQGITQATNELNRAEARQQYQRDGTAPLRSELRKLQEQLQALQKELVAKLKQAADMQQSLQSAVAGRDELRAELGTELKSSLSAAERAELHALQPAVSKLEKDIAAVHEQRLEVAAAAEALEELLSVNLHKQRQDLEDTLAGSSLEEDEGRLGERQAEAEAASQEVETLAEREKEVEQELDQIQKRIRVQSAEKERLSDLTQQDNQRAEDTIRDVGRLKERKQTLTATRVDKERRVKSLGSLPADAFEKYRHKSLKALRAELAQVAEQLKPIKDSVNTKAVDQYMNFSEQRDELVRRKQENDQAARKILDLISVLDHRKDEAVERTFKGVAKNFREIFAQLVPGGRGELVMKKRLAADDGGDEGGEEEEGGLEGPSSPRDDTMGKYSGVKVKVSFGGGETMSLKQLSGGQKTLVALAMIFAIQRCDPAPFYLFDEIDAALDPQYRTTVASMLRQQANDPRNPAQFIITTFHPQIVMVADRIYGVSHSNKISRIDTVERDDALEFLQAQEKLQEKQRGKRAADRAAEEEEEGGEEGEGEEMEEE